MDRLRKESQPIYEDFIQDWTGEPTVYPKYEQKFIATHAWASSLGILDILSGQFSTTKEIQGTMLGENAREFTVFEPEDFFESVVLQQEGATEWLQQMLSTQGNALSRKSRPTGIWVCVGLIYIQSGEVSYGANEGKDGKIAANVDPGIVATGVPTGRSAARIEAGGARQNGVETAYEQVADQVWAAQWHQIKVSYGKAVPGKTERPMAFELMQIESDASNYRGVDGSSASEKVHYQVAEIVGLTSINNHLEVACDCSVEPLRIDERPYHDATKDIDWDLFNHDLDYLRAGRGGAMVSRSDVAVST